MSIIFIWISNLCRLVSEATALPIGVGSNCARTTALQNEIFLTFDKNHLNMVEQHRSNGLMQRISEV